MKRYLLAVIVSTAAIFVMGCSTTVQTDYDHEADFGSYSTYTWYMQKKDKKGPTDGANQIVDKRIRRAISEGISSKGFSEAAAPAEADFFVTYYTSLSSYMRVHHAGWGYGWGHGWGYGGYWRHGYYGWPGWAYTAAYPYHEGTIIVDIIDREKRQLVWRGVISKALSKNSASEEKINKSIARVMAGFPPA